MSACGLCSQQLTRNPIGLMSCDTAGCWGNLTERLRPRGEPTVTLNGYDLTFRRVATRIPISAEQLGQPPARPLPPVPWRRRVRARVSGWWWAHRPRLHFGPCPTDEEDWT